MTQKVKFLNAKGEPQEVELQASIYREADAANLNVQAYINRQFETDPTKYGTAFDQMLASISMVVPDAKTQRELGLRAPSMYDVLHGGAVFSAAANTAGVGAPQGSQSRTLFPAAIVAYMENALVKDYETDANTFDKLIAQTISVPTDRFEQPVINMSGVKGGPMEAKAQRRAQLAPPPVMMSFTTTDVTRKIPTFALGMEFSKEALRATTLDLVGMATRRQLQVERDAWVYSNLSDIISGDNDVNTGSLASLGYSVATNTLDSSAASGTITQKAWLKWLYRLRKYRKIDWVICDLDSYLKLEARTGRPSLTAIDTLLPRMEAHGFVQNPGIGDVKVWLVDDAASGGPVAASTLLGLDSRYALIRVRNTSADVTAAEQYALRQAEAFSIQFGEMIYRQYPEALDMLTIA
jgi:hypothetical protein